MTQKRKICVITGTRAEYGLLYWLLKKIEKSPTLQLQLLVTGMHLSSEFGLTYKVIEEEFHIDKKIEMPLLGDSAVEINRSMGIAQVGFAQAYEKLKPDMIVLLGDRYEIFTAASAAMISRIPIAHIHGGELTEGLIDEAIRHSITKMSHLHFTSTQTYQNRVIQLGEQPNHVFNVGALGIENIKKLQLLDKKAFEESINFKLNQRNLLVTFHPVTLENGTAQEHFQALLNALDTLNHTNIIFTKANSDMNGRIINSMIDAYVNKDSQHSISFESMGQLRYLSALQFVDGVVGNSSSGLLEAPSFKIGTINIGDRQKGRIKANSIIDCLPETKSILSALNKLYSNAFTKQMLNVTNPYDNGNSSQKIVNVLESVSLENILKKSFYDLEV